MAWHLEGTYFENCPCDMVCPCRASPGRRDGGGGGVVFLGLALLGGTEQPGAEEMRPGVEDPEMKEMDPGMESM